jgi:cytochrome c oxidase subunit 2
MKSIVRCLVTVALVVAAGSAAAQPAPRADDKPSGSAAPTSATSNPAARSGAAQPGAAAGATTPSTQAQPADQVGAPTTAAAGSASAQAPTAAGGSAPPADTAPAAGAGSAAPAAAAGGAGVAWYDALANKPIEEDGTFWMPKAVNEPADASDLMFYSVLGLSIFFFVGITIAVIYFVLKYRHRPGHKAEPSAAHNDALEITWTVIPTIIVVFLFWYGWRSYIHVVTPPQKAVEIQVLAWRWNWQFTHANGVTDSDLHIPVDTPVRLVMTSKDVLHSFYAPAMRVKQDVVPRRYTYAWLKATKPGTYRLNCAEYCGTAHAQMACLETDKKTGACLRRATVVVHEKGDYERYLADKANALGNLPPEQLGKSVYEKKGCNACHTIDGSPRVGPSFKGSFGTDVKLADGTIVKMDENYIRESLMSPQAKARPGFPPSMPSFEGQLKEKEIEGIIAFIKSLK